MTRWQKSLQATWYIIVSVAEVRGQRAGLEKTAGYEVTADAWCLFLGGERCDGGHHQLFTHFWSSGLSVFQASKCRRCLSLCSDFHERRRRRGRILQSSGKGDKGSRNIVVVLRDGISVGRNDRVTGCYRPQGPETPTFDTPNNHLVQYSPSPQEIQDGNCVLSR